jgi:hypothetical protein
MLTIVIHCALDHAEAACDINMGKSDSKIHSTAGQPSKIPFNSPISAGTMDILFLKSCSSFNFRMFENISGAIEEILLSPTREGERE